MLLMAGVVLALYANTLNAPFQWDGEEFVLKNSFVTEKGLIFEPSRASGHKWYAGVTRRYTGYLSFALNYSLHGNSPVGYHVFNITVHVMNSLLVYFMALLLFRSPTLKDTPLAERSDSIAMWAVLIFAAHPVQTEAVTYIFQRHASLVGLFYLGSIVAYLMWRVGGRVWWYALALISAVVSMKTKENAFTLPLMIVLIEYFFFSLPKREGSPDSPVDSLKGKNLLWLVPILLTMLVVPLSLVGLDRPAGEVMAGLGQRAGSYASLEGGGREYLITQVRVVSTYLRLFILPINQNLDYDYLSSEGAGTLSFFAAGCLHLLLWLAAGYMLVKGRRGGRGEFTLIGFGIVWFYLALSVESSVIKIPMVMNEYRMYVPLAGLALGASVLVHEIRWDRIRKVVLVVLVVSLAMLTVSRNDVWRSKVSLWEDIALKSPRNAKAHSKLGNAYDLAGRSADSIKAYRKSIDINPYNPAAYLNMGVTYMNLGRFDSALHYLDMSVRQKPDFVPARYSLGKAYFVLGRYAEAEDHLGHALKLNPYHTDASRLLMRIRGRR